MEPKISIIAAIGGKKRALGKDNKLLWNIPEDTKRFKDLTYAHAVIMGRKTFESIGKPLANRMNFIVTRDPNYAPTGKVTLASSLEEAIEKAKECEVHEIFIIGGGQIYEQGMKYADTLYLTVVEGEFKDVDTFFPDYSAFKKKLSEQTKSSNGYTYTFLDLER